MIQSMRKLFYLTIPLIFTHTNFLMAQSSAVTSGKKRNAESRLLDSYFGPVEVRNLEALNSPELEMCPVPYREGLLFTATYGATPGKGPETRAPKRYTDLYYAPETGEGTYGAPERLEGAVNGPLHDGMACISRDGRTMYFTRNNKNGRAEDGIVDLKICRAEWDGKAWTKVVDLPFNSKAFSNCHPSLSADNQRLYFASNRPGGQGGMDLYVCQWENGKWQDPVNLGPSINTAKNEIFPYSGADGNFYFASDGHPGMGGLDLFLSLGPEMGDWGKVENLGAAFNSPSDDFGLVCTADGSEGYFSSSRAGGQGRDDIYQWTLRPKLVLGNVPTHSPGSTNPETTSETVSLDQLMATRAAELEVRAYPRATAQNSNNESFFGEQDWETPVTAPGPVRTNHTPAPVPVRPETTSSWSSRVELKRAGDNTPETETTEVLPSLNDLMERVRREWENSSSTPQNSTTGTVSVKDTEPMASTPNHLAPARGTMPSATSQSTPPKLATGQVFRLEDIYFDFDQAELKPQSRVELDKLVGLMQQYPEMKITILSHTDARGAATYNFDLSQRRAEAVIAYLIARRIDRQRLRARGYGEYRPVNHCGEGVDCNDTEHARNRRTEFQVDELGSTMILPPSATSPEASWTWRHH